MRLRNFSLPRRITRSRGSSQGAIHSAKISGNFGLKLNESVRSNRKSFEKSGPPFEVDHFSQLDRSDQKRPILNPSTSLFEIFHVQHEGEHLPLQLSWTVNSGSIGVTRTAMCSYKRSGAASRFKCMFWLLTTLKGDLFPERIWKVLFVMRKWPLRTVWSTKPVMVVKLLRTKQLTQYY